MILSIASQFHLSQFSNVPLSDPVVGVVPDILSGLLYNLYQQSGSEPTSTAKTSQSTTSLHFNYHLDATQSHSASWSTATPTATPKATLSGQSSEGRKLLKQNTSFSRNDEFKSNRAEVDQSDPAFIEYHASRKIVEEKTLGRNVTGVEDVIGSILSVLMEYSRTAAAATTSPTGTAQPENGASESIDKWLDDILDLAAAPDVLAAALEIYREQATPQDDLYKLMAGKRVNHKRGETAIQSPTQNLTEDKKSDTTDEVPTAANRVTAADRHIAAKDGDDLLENVTSSILTTNDADFMKYSEQDENAKRRNIHIHTANIVADESPLTHKISINWLVIAVCLTFSITCLCTLGVVLSIYCTNRKKFNADTWWNEAGSGLQGMWMGSETSTDACSERRLQQLYTLHGEQLHEQVCRMVHGTPSSSSSLSTEPPK